ncbi:hypothetical protein GCM10010411_95320 [Actinomadura fulvescens]|uniref:Transposase n=1 Tax=Actinomadura fulvescens TaxID=46160 RepID=A0ABN3R0A0_9ACTN
MWWSAWECGFVVGGGTSPTSPSGEGWLYLATVIDIGSRRVVGWATTDHLRTELVTDALKATYNNLHRRLFQLNQCRLVQIGSHAQ